MTKESGSTLHLLLSLTAVCMIRTSVVFKVLYKTHWIDASIIKVGSSVHAVPQASVCLKFLLS